MKNVTFFGKLLDTDIAHISRFKDGALKIYVSRAFGSPEFSTEDIRVHIDLYVMTARKQLLANAQMHVNTDKATLRRNAELLLMLCEAHFGVPLRVRRWGPC